MRIAKHFNAIVDMTDSAGKTKGGGSEDEFPI